MNTKRGLHNRGMALALVGGVMLGVAAFGQEGTTAGVRTTATYRITDLGTLGGSFSQANGMNNFGQIVGAANLPTESERAFLWSATTGMQDLGTLGGNWSVAYGINGSGQVVGASETSGGAGHAFIRQGGNPMDDLGTLGGSWSEARAINDQGYAVGGSETFDLGAFYSGLMVSHTVAAVRQARGVYTHAFIWDTTNGMQDLGALPGGWSSQAYDINNLRQVVGESETLDGYGHAFLWDPETGMEDLGALGGSWSAAYGINDLGHVVGQSETAAAGYHAFIWDSVRGMRDLMDPGTVPRAGSDEPGNASARGTAPRQILNSAAFDINNAGEAVGFGKIPAGEVGQDIALLWDPTTGVVDLNTVLDPGSGWFLERANAIDEQGNITGVGYLGGFQRAFLLTKVVTYSLRTAVQGSGSIQPAPGTYEYNAGTSVTLSATAAPGWQFDRWSGSLTGSENPVMITMNSDKDITAIFTQLPVQGFIYYVSVDGDDSNLGATPFTAFRTIQKAVDTAHLATPEDLSATVYVGPGLFESAAPVRIKSRVNVVGFGRDYTIIRTTSGGATYFGVILEPDSSLDGVTVSLPSSITTPAILVYMGDSGTIHLKRCRIEGYDNPNVNSEGVRVRGGTAETFLVADCEILGVTTGLHAFGSGVNVTRNFFRDIAGVAVWIEGGLAKQAGGEVPMLGDATDIENTGLNSFNNIGGQIVNNTVDTGVSAELNDWGTYTLSEISKRKSANVDAWPYLGKGIGPGSVVAAVTDNNSVPVSALANPQCTIQQLGLPGVRDPDSQTFIFTSVPEGQWTVQASATGFSPNSAVLNVVAAQVNPVALLLAKQTGGGTCGAKEARFLYASCLLGIWTSDRYYRRRRNRKAILSSR